MDVASGQGTAIHNYPLLLVRKWSEDERDLSMNHIEIASWLMRHDDRPMCFIHQLIPGLCPGGEVHGPFLPFHLFPSPSSPLPKAPHLEEAGIDTMIGMLDGELAAKSGVPLTCV
jgi:hypothetical protein